MYRAHSHVMCSTSSFQYPTPYTPSHPRPPLLIASVINMSKKTQCPYCLRMFNSERLMRHCLQCSVRMTMANNNIFKPKITSATQPIRNDTTISFEMNQDYAASKLGTQSYKASANDALTYYRSRPPSETKYLTFEKRHRRLLHLEASANQLLTGWCLYL